MLDLIVPLHKDMPRKEDELQGYSLRRLELVLHMKKRRWPLALAAEERNIEALNTEFRSHLSRKKYCKFVRISLIFRIDAKTWGVWGTVNVFRASVRTYLKEHNGNSDPTRPACYCDEEYSRYTFEDGHVKVRNSTEAPPTVTSGAGSTWNDVALSVKDDGPSAGAVRASSPLPNNVTSDSERLGNVIGGTIGPTGKTTASTSGVPLNRVRPTTAIKKEESLSPAFYDAEAALFDDSPSNIEPLKPLKSNSPDAFAGFNGGGGSDKDKKQAHGHISIGTHAQPVHQGTQGPIGVVKREREDAPKLRAETPPESGKNAIEPAEGRAGTPEAIPDPNVAGLAAGRGGNDAEAQADDREASLIVFFAFVLWLIRRRRTTARS